MEQMAEIRLQLGEKGTEGSEVGEMLTGIPLRGQGIYHKCKKLIMQGYQVNHGQFSKN